MRDAGLRQKKTRRRWLSSSAGFDLVGCFADYLKPIAFFGDHSESASVVPFDVNRAKSVNMGDDTFVSPLQLRVRVA
jgi:hypothetical protein